MVLSILKLKIFEFINKKLNIPKSAIFQFLVRKNQKFEVIYPKNNLRKILISFQNMYYSTKPMYSNVGINTRINSYITGGLNKYDKITYTPFSFNFVCIIVIFKLFMCTSILKYPKKSVLF